MNTHQQATEILTSCAAELEVIKKTKTPREFLSECGDMREFCTVVVALSRMQTCPIMTMMLGLGYVGDVETVKRGTLFLMALEAMGVIAVDAASETLSLTENGRKMVTVIEEKLSTDQLQKIDAAAEILLRCTGVKHATLPWEDEDAWIPATLPMEEGR